MIKAHKIGVNAVSWAPACSGMRLVTGGCDNLVKIWNCDESSTWVEVSTLGRADERHTDWVRDVAWAPTVDGAAEMIASCSQDKKVIIWTAGRSGEWVPKTIQMSWCATRRSNRRAHSSLHVCVCACAPPPPPPPPARLDDKVTLSVCFSLRSAVWSVSWSVTGGILAVAGGDNQVTLWRESHVDEWVQIGALEEGGGGLLPSS